MNKLSLHKLIHRTHWAIKTCPLCKHPYEEHIVFVECKQSECEKVLCPVCTRRQAGYCTRHYHLHQKDLKKLRNWQQGGTA